MVRRFPAAQAGAMTQTVPPPPPPPPPPGAGRQGWNTEHLRDYTALRRSRTDRKVAGVSGGLGQHLDVDPTLLRVLFVVLAFFGGAGLLLYAVLWAVVPQEGDPVPRTSDGTRNALIIGAVAVAVLLVLGVGWDEGGFPWPFGLVALVVAGVLLTRDNRPGAGSPAPPGGGTVDTAPVDLTKEAAGSTPTRTGATAYVAPAPPRPRRRGPLLFAPTLALIALALGTLGLVDAGGVEVADAAYPALALAVVGAMLAVGSVLGRPGGLVALGVVASLALAAVGIGEPRFTGDRNLLLQPTTAAAVLDDYRVPAGRIELDLRQVEDLQALDGRTLHLSANAGELLVALPLDLAVDYRADVRYGGTIEVGSRVGGGWSYDQRGSLPAIVPDSTGSDPRVLLDLDLRFGHIEVVQG